MDFAIPTDHTVKNQRKRKRDKNLDFDRELRKLWNITVTVIPIMIDALGTVPKGLERELSELDIGGRIETIKTT